MPGFSGECGGCEEEECNGDAEREHSLTGALDVPLRLASGRCVLVGEGFLRLSVGFFFTGGRLRGFLEVCRRTVWRVILEILWNSRFNS